MSRPRPQDQVRHHHMSAGAGGGRLYENQRTVSPTMLDSITSEIGRAGLMHQIEQELIRSVVEAGARDGEILDVPMVTWTCRVVGRSKGEGTQAKSQVTGL